MALTPQRTQTQPNDLYAQHLALGMGISNGAPVGFIHSLVLRGAYVDPNTGAWSDAAGTGTVGGITFSFDGQGNITGLPGDLQTLLAPKIAELWPKLVEAIGIINGIRKLV